MEWVALYKFGRLALLAISLCGIAVYLYGTSRGRSLEDVATRMLEEGEER